MLYDRFHRRRKVNTVIPMENMITSEGVIFFGEDPGIIDSEALNEIELSPGSGYLSK